MASEHRASRKPRIRPESIPWLMEIWRAAHEWPGYWRDDRTLEQLPSDHLDGRATARDVRDLVRRRILYVCPIPADERCGEAVTWGFTPRGLAIMRAWKEREPMRPAAPEPRVPSCQYCGEPITALIEQGDRDRG